MDSGTRRQETLNHPVQLVSQTLEFFLDGMELPLHLRERLPLSGLAGLHLLPLLGYLLLQPGFTVIDFAFQELTGGQ